MTASNIAIHIGECKNAGLTGVPVHAEGNIVWAEELYAKKSLKTFDDEGNIIPDIVFKGEWEAGTYTKNNRVGYMGCIYLCIVQSTTSRPRYDNPDWFMEGNPNFIMSFTSSEGWTFIGDNIDTVIIATVIKYNQDMTSDIPYSQYSWTRASSDTESDKIWNAQHLGFGNTIHLLKNDIPGYGIRKVAFTCIAIIDIDNSISESFTA